MTEEMKAIGLYQHLPITNNESLVDVSIPKPRASGHDLVVQVKAVSVNPVDTKLRANGEEEETPKILGYDAAGIVTEVGEKVTLFQPGDEVYYAGSIDRPGTNSAYHAVDERIVGKKPATITFEEAAAMPLTSLTAYEGLYDRLGISRQETDNEGKSILIIGAAGGVGSIATQIASRAGLTVIGTASREETITWAQNHGAEYIINHHKALSTQLHDLGFPFVDYIFCLSSTADHWEEMVASIKPQGKIASIVETEEPLNLTALQSKSATFVWEFMFTRPLYQTEDMIEQHHILSELCSLIDKGYIDTTINETIEGLTAHNLQEAHRLVESGKMIGKVVVTAKE
ncbi:zinc-binding alcohol dehydrogenase family protein [Pontibacillus salicampi]|uniref:Zinc-type alcohol dehydrogenase-like protein n=1 Tax=Pontibacillus salicampi TaxID=1449801 RepID=A0ABV6LKX0_9BACI